MVGVLIGAGIIGVGHHDDEESKLCERGEWQVSQKWEVSIPRGGVRVEGHPGHEIAVLEEEPYGALENLGSICRGSKMLVMIACPSPGGERELG